MQMEMQSKMLLERARVPQTQYPLPAERKRAVRDFKRINNQRINRLESDRGVLAAEVQSVIGDISPTHPLRQSRAMIAASLVTSCVTEPSCADAFTVLVRNDRRSFVAKYDLFYGATQGIDELIMGLCRQLDPSLFDAILVKKLGEGSGFMGEETESADHYLNMHSVARRAGHVLHDTITGADVVRLSLQQAKLAFMNRRIQNGTKPTFGQQPTFNDVLIPELALAGAEESLAAYERLYRLTEGI